MLELRYYLTTGAKSPFEEWFEGLDASAAAKVATAVTRLGHGNLSNTKGVGEGVLEYRIDWGPGYRVYFGRDGETLVILLAGGTKRRQQKGHRRRQGALGGLQTKAREVAEAKMALTKSFKELVQKRVAADPAFAEALLREGIDTMLTGDVDTGKTILRDYIKATVGFEKLGEATDTPAKSLIRMFGPRGNPQAKNLFGIIGYLQKQAGIELHVAPEPR
jgi:putative addiction module killer protein